MIAGFAARFAFGGLARLLVPLVFAGGLALTVNSCTAKLEAAGAAKYRSAVLSAVAKDNAAQADAQAARLTREREANARERKQWQAREQEFTVRLADLREPPEEGFQCPDVDTWARLQRCPYSSPSH